MLLHILLFDKSYSLTYWLNFAELRAQLRRRHQSVTGASAEAHCWPEDTVLARRATSLSYASADALSSTLRAASAPRALGVSSDLQFHTAAIGNHLLQLDAAARTVAYQPPQPLLPTFGWYASARFAQVLTKYHSAGTHSALANFAVFQPSTRPGGGTFLTDGANPLVAAARRDVLRLVVELLHQLQSPHLYPVTVDFYLWTRVGALVLESAEWLLRSRADSYIFAESRGASVAPQSAASGFTPSDCLLAGPRGALALRLPRLDDIASDSVGAMQLRIHLTQYYHLLGCLDYLNDWRTLKLEREL